MQDHYDVSAHTQGGYMGYLYSVDSAYSVGEWVGQYDGIASWVYQYKISAHAESDGYVPFVFPGFIMSAAVDIKITSCSDIAYISPPGQNYYCWSYPASSGTNSSVGVSRALFEAALSLLYPEVSTVMSVVNAIMGLLNVGGGSQTDSDYSLWRIWRWSPNIDDTDQAMYYKVYVPLGESATYYARYVVFGQGYEVLIPSSVIFNLTAPESLSGESNPELMSEEEREEAGIITVSRDNLREFSQSIGLPEESIQANLSSDQSVFYFTTQKSEVTIDDHAVVYNLNKENVTIDSIKEAIDFHIDRSEMILKAFGSTETIDIPGNFEVCEKHRSRIQDLNQLKSDLIAGRLSLSYAFDLYSDAIKD